jgi:bacterial/archaeal transporter family protein
MHIAPWAIPALVVLVAWGVVGIFQKLATNHISAESTLFWMIAGFVLFQPFIYPGKILFTYSTRGLVYGLLSGLLSNLGAWGLYAAMRSGGKASVVAPLVSLYPVVVVVVAPFLLHETLTVTQGAGVACALVSVALLSA